MTFTNETPIKLLSISLITALFAASCSAGQNKGLIACWSFDEGKGSRVLDTSGNGNHGTIHGATWTKGRVKGCLKFDGVDDYISVPASASLNSAKKEITLMCWIKTPLSGRYSILSKWPCDKSNQRCFELDVDSDGKLVRLGISPNGVTGTWSKTAKTLPSDKWVHIAATFDGKAVKIYIDGKLAHSSAFPDSPQIHPSTADLNIGAWMTGKKLESFFKGSIDEIRIYSRAMPHKEILEGYIADVPKGTVTGKIVSKSGVSVAGAKINVGNFIATSDEAGKYKVAVPTGTFDLNVTKKRYKARAKSGIKVKTDETTTVNISLVPDETPPAISDVKTADIDGISATIAWKTNEKCKGIVRYGTASGKYPKAVKGPLFVKSHRIALTGLTSGTKYHFIVESTDSAGNSAKSKEYTLTTRKIEHPRLIVRKSDYPAMRARAARSPWKEMKAEAVSYIKKNSYSPKKDEFVGSRYSKMSSIVRNGALAYILDPENKTLYKDKIVAAMSNWDKLYVRARDWTGHNGQYYLNADWSAAFFNSVLALDVIHDDLTDAQRADLEAKLDKVAGWYHAKASGVYHCANYGLWAIYKGDRPRIDSAKTKWRAGYSGWFSSDGVFLDGPGYAICSANSRHGKMHFHHVLEFTGEDNTWYSDPKIDGFYEWLYGAAFSPFYRMISFADTGPNRAYDPFDPGVHKFSMKAFANLAWCANDRMPSGSLFHYALMDKPFPKPKKPLSRIWPDGCAAFWEDNPSDRSLMGVLWNCKNTRHGGDGHSHKEVNAIHLCAYGEHILRNSGYTNWGNGALGFTWDYVHHSAVSANTVLIDGADHAEKKGAGITEGFTAPRFDYAGGDSKDALPNGKHRRNFCFVHPQDGRCGYWVLFDEVQAEKASSKINVLLHPSSENCKAVADKLEYKWKIGPKRHTYSGQDVFVNIFLATPPASVGIKPGLLANMGSEKDCFVGKYIYSTYDTDRRGQRNIVTVIFPYDAKHPKAKMTRIAGDDFTGAKINLGKAITDVAIESSGKKAVKCGSVSFRGLAALYRIKGDKNAFYFVREGRSFDDGAQPRHGFKSDADVSVYVKGDSGKIISPGGAKVTLVKFYHPDITGVTLNGKPAMMLDSGNGWVWVAVGKGTFDLKFRLTDK